MNSVIEAGIDYIAMTLAATDADYTKWVTSCQAAIDLLINHGNIPKIGSFRGYDGVWCQGAFTGQREDGAYLMVAGGWASRLWSQVHHERAHYSRLDVQATVQLEEANNDLAQQSYRAADTYNNTRVLRQRRKLRYMSSNDGGSTLYIGSRSSDHFCRLYNKDAQSGDEFYRNCWRYEVELHNDSATAAARYLASGLRSQTRACAASVWHYYETRGVHPPWERQGEDNAVLPRTVPSSDLERKLAWLRAQVAPTIELLMQHVPDTIVMQALGLAPEGEPFPVENWSVGSE